MSNHSLSPPSRKSAREASSPLRMEGRVLVVDDTEAKRYFIRRTLRAVGMEVLEAASGQEALSALALQPDVVLLDVRLPDMSGFEVCRRLKEDPATAGLPVLYVSSLMRDEELEARLFEDGADGYIPQPIEPKHLVAQTWALVRMRRGELARQREREEAQAEQARLQHELDKEQARARRLTESGLVGTFYWDLDGSILDANDTFLAMVGYTREDLEQGRLDWRRLIPPEWEEQTRQDVQSVLDRGMSSLAEKQYLRKDGSRLDVLRGGAVFEGESHRGVTVVLDITARREAERRSKQLLGELETSEARLRLALDSASLGVWSHDPSTGRLEWDARTRELFGVLPDEPVEVRTWLELVHPDDRERVEAADREASSGAKDGVLELEYRALGLRNGGVLRWLSARGRLQGGAGGQRRLMGTVLDITERKLAEQHAAALLATTAAFAHALTPRQVADALVEHGLKSLDACAGTVCLKAGEALVVLGATGYREDVVEPHRRMPLTASSPLTQAARTGRTVWVESLELFERGWPEFARLAREGRSRSWVSVPMVSGEDVVGVLGLSFPTPRRFNARELAHLEALCGLGAQALLRARLYEETKRREELEQQFLGMVSHDLRNPLQAISLGAHTLQRMERPSPEVLLRVSGRIASSADTMGRMISDLLDFTRGRLGGGIPLTRTEGDLMRLCREVIDEFTVTHPSGDIRLEGEAPCEGSWDGPRMRQVLSNLLSNALRYARAGTAVTVRVRALKGEVELTVTNEGEPIPEELMPVLFEPFRRGSAKFRPSGSLGLGLYIVRQVVEGHGGRVEVASGGGATTFTVRVPCGA